MTILTPVPNDLVNGTVSDATLVDANFAAIVAGVNANAAENGVNASITQLVGLTTPLTPSQGGTQSYACGTAGGTANALVLTPVTPSAGFALHAGVRATCIIASDNTAATTANIGGTGVIAVDIANAAGLVACAGGELQAGTEADFMYTGAVWQLMNPFLPALGSAYTGANAFSNTVSETFNGPMNFNEQALVITSNIAAWDMSLAPDASATNAANFSFALPTNIPAKGRGRLRINNSSGAPITVTWNGVFAALPNSGSLITNVPSGLTYFEWWVSSGTIYVSRLVMNGPLNYLLTNITTSGSASDFVIPPWAKRITVSFNGVQTNGTSRLQVQIGNGSPETTGYVSEATSTGQVTSGFITSGALSTTPRYGHMLLINPTGNTWTESNSMILGTASNISGGAGLKTTSGIVTILRVAPVNATDTFSGNSISVLVEG